MNFKPMIDIDDCEPSGIPYEDDLIFAMQNLREHLRFHTKMLKKDQRKAESLRPMRCASLPG